MTTNAELLARLDSYAKASNPKVADIYRTIRDLAAALRAAEDSIKTCEEIIGENGPTYLQLRADRDRLAQQLEMALAHQVLAEDERDRLAQQVAEARSAVDEQAEDAGLWFVAQTAPEAYLQHALRRLHVVIEGDAARAKTEGGG